MSPPVYAPVPQGPAPGEDGQGDRAPVLTDGRDARVARDLGLNRKTVQRYDTRLREAIAAESECSLEQLCGEIEVDESYFGGVREGKRGRGAGSPGRVSPAAGQVHASGRDQDSLDVEGFHHVCIAHETTFGGGKAHLNGIENFWGFAKRRLKMYHGGFKQNFPLFMREMEFRFHHRDDPDAVRCLYKLLNLVRINGPIP